MRKALLVLGLLLPVAVAAGDLPLDLPGAPPLSAGERARRSLAATRLAAAPDQPPRYVNRLVDAASPYLEQHALQPVDWYPWGEEALTRARRENKPILLSIGYSTCHWCHVMAAESFADPTIAAQINRDFIAIKVDREERPDLDAVYVDAVQRLTGSAGWPLTVFLTPERKPFFGGTYFPPADRDGRVGLPRLLSRMAEVWRDERDNAVAAADDLLAQLKPPPPAPGSIDRSAWTAASNRLKQDFDRQLGGLRGAPKFPPTQSLALLLRRAAADGDAEALQLVELTLDRMAEGALHDQVGGGFHRYTVDAAWRRPHFEKMLYDQALLARVYLEAHHLTRAARHAAVARDILQYVERDLTAADGTFCAAEDAVSGGSEGGFYMWTIAQVQQALGPERGALAAKAFGVTAQPAALHLATQASDLAQRRGVPSSEIEAQLVSVRRDLRHARDQRPRPRRDDKLLPAWNGLMIASFAYGARVLEDPALAATAARAANAILSRITAEQPLAHAYRTPPGRSSEVASGPAYLDDYAYLALGLLELYEATFDDRWLYESVRLARELVRRFGTDAGLRYISSQHEPLIGEVDAGRDTSLPAPRAVAAWVLARLGHMTQTREFSERAASEIAAMADGLRQQPWAYAGAAVAADFLLGPQQEIVLAGTADVAATANLAAAAQRPFLPRSVYLRSGPLDSRIGELAPFVRKQIPQHGQPTAYVCRNYTCTLPVTDPASLSQRLIPTPTVLP